MNGKGKKRLKDGLCYGSQVSDQTEKYHRKVLGKIGPGD